MSRLRLQVSRDGKRIIDGNADDYTVVLHDTQSGIDPVFMYGDGNHGVWVFLPGEDDPNHITATRSEE